jgi:hypothetical protein
LARKYSRYKKLRAKKDANEKKAEPSKFPSNLFSVSLFGSTKSGLLIARIDF